MTDREAIKIFSQQVKALRREREMLDCTDDTEVFKTAIAAKERAIKARELAISALRYRLDYDWISVEDRLPEVGIEKCLVFIKHKYGDIITMGRYWGEYGWDFGASESEKTSRVTHWRPLPAPPDNIKV